MVDTSFLQKNQRKYSNQRNQRNYVQHHAEFKALGKSLTSDNSLNTCPPRLKETLSLILSTALLGLFTFKVSWMLPPLAGISVELAAIISNCMLLGTAACNTKSDTGIVAFEFTMFKFIMIKPLFGVGRSNWNVMVISFLLKPMRLGMLLDEEPLLRSVEAVRLLKGSMSSKLLLFFCKSPIKQKRAKREH